MVSSYTLMLAENRVVHTAHRNTGCCASANKFSAIEVAVQDRQLLLLCRSFQQAVFKLMFGAPVPILHHEWMPELAIQTMLATGTMICL